MQYRDFLKPLYTSHRIMCENKNNSYEFGLSSQSFKSVREAEPQRDGTINLQKEKLTKSQTFQFQYPPDALMLRKGDEVRF